VTWKSDSLNVRLAGPDTDMINEFLREVGKALRALDEWPHKKIQLFHHNDADGLSSGAILLRALERAGFDVRRVCLEKPYPALLKRIYDQPGRILVFADFAGRIAPLLSDLNRERNLTLILDHHAAQPACDPKVHNLDPELFGLKGDRDITASTTCYLFARAMDSSNRDLAPIAVIGAVGDGFFTDNRLASHNRDPVQDAVRQGLLEVKIRGNAEQYIVKTPAGPMPCDELSSYLDTLGAAGYYQGGPEMGIRVCLQGPSAESDRVFKSLMDIKTAAFEEEIFRLQAGALKHTPHLQWFHVKDRFAPMGVKMIGSFCKHIKEKDFLDPKRYLAGFQWVPDEIPGFGNIAMNQVKISMRVSAHLETEIRKGNAAGLNALLPEATNRLGGFSDACHSLAAATTIEIGKEGALIEAMESMLSR